MVLQPGPTWLCGREEEFDQLAPDLRAFNCGRQWVSLGLAAGSPGFCSQPCLHLGLVCAKPTKPTPPESPTVPSLSASLRPRHAPNASPSFPQPASSSNHSREMLGGDSGMLPCPMASREGCSKTGRLVFSLPSLTFSCVKPRSGEATFPSSSPAMEEPRGGSAGSVFFHDRLTDV